MKSEIKYQPFRFARLHAKLEKKLWGASEVAVLLRWVFNCKATLEPLNGKPAWTYWKVRLLGWEFRGNERLTCRFFKGKPEKPHYVIVDHAGEGHPRIAIKVASSKEYRVLRDRLRAVADLRDDLNLLKAD